MRTLCSIKSPTVDTVRLLLFLYGKKSPKTEEETDLYICEICDSDEEKNKHEKLKPHVVAVIREEKKLENLGETPA